MARIEDFQRNFAFVAFMLIVCFGVFVYLTRSSKKEEQQHATRGFHEVKTTFIGL